MGEGGDPFCPSESSMSNSCRIGYPRIERGCPFPATHRYPRAPVSVGLRVSQRGYLVPTYQLTWVTLYREILNRGKIAKHKCTHFPVQFFWRFFLGLKIKSFFFFQCKIYVFSANKFVKLTKSKKLPFFISPTPPKKEIKKKKTISN